MSALNTDLVRNASPNFATTLANTMLSSDTSMTLQSTIGLPTATAITLVIDATDPISGLPTPTLKETITGVVSGSTVTSLLRGLDGTSAQAHASGANVVMWITANLWNDFQSSYLTQHTQLGAHAGITNTGGLTTDTLTVTGTSTLSAPYNPYKFFVYRNAALNSSSSAVVFDTKFYDTGSNYSTSTGAFTAPVAGFYIFSCTLTLSYASTGNYIAIEFIKNGSSANMPTSGFVTTFNTTFQESVSLTTPLLQLNANDAITIISGDQGGHPFVVGASPVTTYFSGEFKYAT